MNFHMIIMTFIFYVTTACKVLRRYNVTILPILI